MTDRTDQISASHAISPAILTTKFYRSPVSADLEPRTELVARLERHRRRALTLITAPTGYGKSTLVSIWLDASEAHGCWISLDEEDDDPRTFLAYVVAAIQSAFPDIPLYVQTFLEASVFPLPSAVGRTLLNDLAQLPRRLLLALDDLHVIRSQAVYDILAELLRHPSPTLHLVLISRRDPPLPLPSLRAHNQITEIRTRDLRFSSADTASLLTKLLNREIDSATAAVWTERTEGWVTALNLAAIALRQRDQDDQHPDDGPVDSQHLQEYLLVEVMNRLDPILREWLLTIAWLDRFCPELCTAVCQPDSAAAPADLTGEAFIQRLQDDNLFVIPLDSENHWFRLHHLFRELLQTWGRKRGNDDEIAALHRRAGVWFAQQELPDEAIRHLVLAGDIAEAEKVVLHHRYALMNSEQWIRLERWLHQFPDNVVTSSAMLTSTVAFICMHAGQPQKVNGARLQAEQLLAGQGPKPGEYNALMGEVLALKALRAIVVGDHVTLDVSTQRALRLLPADALLVRSLVYGAVAAGLQMRGHFADGCRLLEETVDEPQWTPRIQTQIMVYLCLISFMQGDLTTTRAWAERVARIAERLHLAEPLCIARHFLGVVHYLRDELGTAELYLAALDENYVGAAQSHMSMGAFALALIYDKWGDSRRADAVIERLGTYFQAADNAFASEMVEAFTVELALRRGNLGAARRKRIGIDFDSRLPIWYFYLPQLTPIKLLLAEGTPEALGVARAALNEFEERMRRMNRNLARLDGLALLALVCDAQGDSDCADANLTQALLLAQSAGLVRPFVDLGPPMAVLLQRQPDRSDANAATMDAFVERILSAFPASAPAQPEQALTPGHGVQTASVATQPLEPLTARELQIMQLLTTHLAPKEIAARNVVSVSTVRSQIKSIYRKLGVQNRNEAIRRSRELNIV